MDQLIQICQLVYISHDKHRDLVNKATQLLIDNGHLKNMSDIDCKEFIFFIKAFDLLIYNPHYDFAICYFIENNNLSIDNTQLLIENILYPLPQLKNMQWFRKLLLKDCDYPSSLVDQLSIIFGRLIELENSPLLQLLAQNKEQKKK